MSEAIAVDFIASVPIAVALPPTTTIVVDPTPPAPSGGA